MAALPAVRLPEIDVPKLNRPSVEVPEAFKSMNVLEIDIPDLDVARRLTDAAVATGLRPARRSRLPFAIAGLIVAGTAAWAVMNSRQLRNRIAELATSVRERVSSIRSSEWDQADPIAFPAAETKPIQPEPWDRREDEDSPDYPEGLGSNNGDRMPAAQENTTPV
jgi:hypothetical protein